MTVQEFLLKYTRNNLCSRDLLTAQVLIWDIVCFDIFLVIQIEDFVEHYPCDAKEFDVNLTMFSLL